MTRKRLGVCIIGAGAMGGRHAACWSSLPEAEVVAVMDIIEIQAQTLAQQQDLDRWYTDYKEAISLSEVDVVSICVPTNLHPEITVFAAEQGKHVLCEKPIALTLAAADAMIEAAGRNNIKLSIGLMRRYSPIMPTLRAWLSEGRLGRPVMYHAASGTEVRPKRAMHDSLGNGGPIIDMGVHLFDSWRYLFDSPPVEIYAQGLKLAKHRRELAHIEEIAYDTAAVTVRYASGDIGSYVVSWGLPPGTQAARVPEQIFGSKGLVQIVTRWGQQEAEVFWEGGRSEPIALFDGDMYQLEIAHFARCILEDRAPLVTGEDGRVALRVALAALESLKSGRPVSLSSS